MSSFHNTFFSSVSQIYEAPMFAQLQFIEQEYTHDVL